MLPVARAEGKFIRGFLLRKREGVRGNFLSMEDKDVSFRARVQGRYWNMTVFCHFLICQAHNPNHSTSPHFQHPGPSF